MTSIVTPTPLPQEVKDLELALRGGFPGVECIHPTEADRVRVTSLKTFELCPFTWACKYLLVGGEAEEEKTGYAAIGTAVHAICEDLLMQLHAGSDAADTTLAWSLVPDEEAAAVRTYLEALTELPVLSPLVVEERFNHRMFPDMPPISGQIDFACYMTEDDVLIVDHKTNRRYQGADHWAGQLQQLLYAWMARKEWPGKRVHFRIGYPNLGTHVQWETDPADDAKLEERVGGMWRRMKEYADARAWPRTVNDECGWCAVKDVCPTRTDSAMKLTTSFQAAVGRKDCFAKLEYIKSVEKVVKEMRASLEDVVAAEIAGGQGRQVTVDGKTWSLVKTERRKAKAMEAMAALNTIAQSTPAAAKQIADMADSVFTVKVTGLDMVASMFPELKPLLPGLAPKVPTGKESIKVSAANPKKSAITPEAHVPLAADVEGEEGEPF